MGDWTPKEQYENVCKDKLDSMHKILQRLEKCLLVGNGSPAMTVQVAEHRVEIEALKQKAHEPRTRTKRIVIDLGKLSAAGGAGGIVWMIIDALKG